jgi:hypothetical protein
VRAILKAEGIPRWATKPGTPDQGFPGLPETILKGCQVGRIVQKQEDVKVRMPTVLAVSDLERPNLTHIPRKNFGQGISTRVEAFNQSQKRIYQVERFGVCGVWNGQGQKRDRSAQALPFGQRLEEFASATF